MSKSKKRSERKYKKPFPYFPVAIGLLLLGFSMLAFMSPKVTDTTGVNDYLVPMAVNYPAPELSLQNLTGVNESLTDFRSQVILVNNWATWCPPCKAEMPTLVAYHNQHTADGFSIIAVEAGEPLDLVAEFAESYKMNFPVWLDPDGKSMRAFGNQSLPSSYVIDRIGTVRYAWTGEISMAMLEKFVTPLISENN